MSKRDDVSLLYSKVSFASKIEKWLFWGIPLLSFVGKITTNMIIVAVISAAQILISLSFVVIRCLNENVFIYEANRERRKSNIENAFEVDMGLLKTDGYYNNNFPPSIGKFIVNNFESVYFSKTIAGKMIVPQVFKSIISLIVFFVACFSSLRWDILLIIVQVLLSGVFIMGLVNVTLFAKRCNSLFDSLYHETVTVGVTSEPQLAIALSHAIEYEVIKAHYKINISTKIFSQQNDALSKKWDEIANKITIEIKE